MAKSAKADSGRDERLLVREHCRPGKQTLAPPVGRDGSPSRPQGSADVHGRDGSPSRPQESKRSDD